MVDLFLEKHDILWNRLKHLQQFSTNTVREIGREIFLASADVRVREWVRKGKLRRISLQEAKCLNLIKPGCQPVAWYEVI